MGCIVSSRRGGVIGGSPLAGEGEDVVNPVAEFSQIGPRPPAIRSSRTKNSNSNHNNNNTNSSGQQQHQHQHQQQRMLVQYESSDDYDTDSGDDSNKKKMSHSLISIQHSVGHRSDVATLGTMSSNGTTFKYYSPENDEVRALDVQHAKCRLMLWLDGISELPIPSELSFVAVVNPESLRQFASETPRYRETTLDAFGRDSYPMTGALLEANHRMVSKLQAAVFAAPLIHPPSHAGAAAKDLEKSGSSSNSTEGADGGPGKVAQQIQYQYMHLRQEKERREGERRQPTAKPAGSPGQEPLLLPIGAVAQ